MKLISIERVLYSASCVVIFQIRNFPGEKVTGWEGAGVLLAREICQLKRLDNRLKLLVLNLGKKYTFDLDISWFLRYKL